ncbi:hypothetical protein SAMN05518800_6941 [Variovorax sp. YR752]|uniref:hypothetical protein n=1 Tax=unclassified Variovorax TaxID=663243 RepID=UPI000BD34397|nr:hypothetical protein [Variovorax sp. YR752]SOE06304.1 hypothetical protein SAMN05518800_6941 [Variovorax sp. YR752]
MTTATDPLTIPPPSGREPLKANAFFAARAAGSQLNPMFPYDDPGSIVPCTSSFRGGPGSPSIGYFHHTNHVDEVAVVFGSSGDMRTGDVFVGAKKHGVGGWGSHGEFFTVMTITQRQVEEGPQPETMGFMCEKCGTELVSLDYDGIVAQQGAEAPYPPLPTILGSFLTAQKYNQSEENRTCKSCGHLHDPFPLFIWGWDRYMFNTGVVNDARAVLEEVSKV